MATKANHHFIPQYYLRGFAEGIGRQARVFTFDSETHKAFTTLVRNVGSRRHFNRVEAEGVDPNFIEDSFAEIEARFASDLSDVIASRSFPSHGHFESVINIMANLSVRNPRLRGNMEKFHKEIAERIGHISVSSREIWESQIRQMKEKGIPVNDDVTYEQAKSFHDRKQYEIVVDQTHLIGLELKMLDPVIKYLSQRNWCFASAAAGSQFITSDDPVVLSWIDREDMGPYGPGHGLMGTIVAFPISPEVALIGTFEDLPESASYEARRVTAVNTMVARYSTKQIYARDGNFRVDLANRQDVLGSDLPGVFLRR